MTKGDNSMATFTNKATLSFTGGSVDSNTVTGTFLESLSMTKTALYDEYSEGSRLTYVISIINSGSTSFTGLTLSDDLGAYTFDSQQLVPLTYADGSILYYINGILQNPPAVTPSPFSISGISVPAGANVTIVYAVNTNEFAPPEAGGSITNTATLTGAGLAEPVTAIETVFAANSPALSITKALSPTTVPENGTVTYTLTIENNGNTDANATDNLVVTDVFDPALSNVTVTLDGTLLTEGVDYTYDELTGLFATTQSRITVPAATYTRQPDGSYVKTPGEAVLVITGNI